ncbi:MAG: tripartite tricarboxylate transporter TctB family protein [Gammaproteobacteria bacterium]|jgi:putative tricarboxylic transport membrane protein|nr:tripartite tricarboxylate transporter TctB family protein [Gammaproteobacteria bacterium]
MTLNKDHIGGLIFLTIAVVYGYFAHDIRMFPGDQFEPFNAQTLPIALAWAGGLISLVMLATAGRSAEPKPTLVNLDFMLVGKLMVLVWLFAQALSWIGFLAATILFLLVGYWLLGERRIRTLLLASIPFAVGFWLLLAKVLDIYLAPGKLWQLVLGA